MNVVQSIGAALTPQGLIWTVILFGIAVFLHELAHYALARAQGVSVRSFSIGMGPVLLKRQWKGTEWRVSALPLGGYVEIDGMAPEDDGQGRARQPTRGFAALPAWGKVAVLLAGPLMNLVLGIGLMTASFSAQGIPALDRARIEDVQAGSRAQTLGLQAGDVIVAIDGRDLPETRVVGGREAPGYEGVRDALAQPGPHTFTVERSGTPRDVRFDWQPSVGGERQRLGIRYGPDVQPAGIGTALSTALSTTAQAGPQVLRSFAALFGQFFTFDLSPDENVSGPIGTAEIVSRAAELGPWALVQIATLLNLSLAFFNLLPIPGLDGGRILLVLVGALRGRPLSFAQEQAINFAGFAFLMTLIAFVWLRDVARFF
ncbi:regulator of sigma E protease [Deinococcus reticulitermitis]|uniref:Regulator of sigma E protease n=1 Tax=Deinococcus reticulitermitis TaxID=856736 RepID=A0A1H7A6G3_9DEIO|nr:M50 family metallopeptidase [Deinococcus reticulitermitis]SEJ61181.1 regulator of sigma E protease [Deinococcus reticulitermitis]